MLKNSIIDEKLTKSDKIFEIIKDVIIICIGLMISSFGTALFYQAGMGSSAMATFSDGLHLLLNISYGTANMTANLAFLMVLFICDRRMINIGTVLCVFMIGIFVDLGNTVFGLLPIATAHVFIRFICMLVGCTMMGIGLALYVAVDRGFGALEGLVKYLCAKTSISFDKVKIGQDLLLLSLGILLHASWGIGTFISAITIGPIMKVFIVKFQKVLKKQ
ncbi:membrane protein [Anaerocolumna aminovalerica]|jgi:uncharacterized membrane protein YczE|uniref:Uncharacterized membrane protein YczE n=1 Tax=Anaerocolumna aminovalerica TaxID=1527 RepID=A0A1I5C3X7_9FIRM|nr:hypothetical protein [Anaerocolumna aminovalerica]MDU6263021.1 hypothetical protein [Anaerocolumna aminovalerica]SFN81723.1 Uncharacterized membrane protein YczE [Anaerocolumna aminovalerica]